MNEPSTLENGGLKRHVSTHITRQVLSDHSHGSDIAPENLTSTSKGEVIVVIPCVVDHRKMRGVGCMTRHSE